MTDFTDDDAAVRGRSRRAAGARTRTHHVVRRSAPLPPLERDDDSGFWTDVDAWIPTLEPAQDPRRRARGVGVDPRLLRLGAVAIASVLMIPIALALREDGDGGEVRSQEPAAFAASGAPGVQAHDRAADPGGAAGAAGRIPHDDARYRRYRRGGDRGRGRRRRGPSRAGAGMRG